jgi:transcriptional antiterminator NusG
MSMAEEQKQNETAEQPQVVPSEGAPAIPAPTNPNFKWYIIHSYSGFERKVKESIESRVQAFGLQDKIGRVMIPTEPVTEIRNGKKYTIERAFLPGYVLVEMDLNDDVWHIIKSTPRVTGFLGTGQHPSPLTEDEVNQIVYRIDTGKDKPKLKVKFQKNEQVRITEGPFATFTGVIDDVNEDKSEVTVMVTIFGRSTPVKLEFGQVDKIVA